MRMQLTHIATREGKLLSFLRRELGLSCALIKRLKYQHAYQVNGQAARTNHPVRPGDAIAVTLLESVPDFPAENMPLSVLYEDDALLAIDKPAGILTHPSFHRLTGTLANGVLWHYQRTGQSSAVHFVNRLDRDTFGVVLVAKNAHVHAIMAAQLQTGNIAKKYTAAVYGCPAQAEGTLDFPIARLSETSLLRCVRDDGKPALSAYRVIARAQGCALLELSPQTGRTHQLRVHCAHAGFPILGDAQYGTEASQAFSLDHCAHTQQLCAACVQCAHPITKKTLQIHSAQAVFLPRHVCEIDGIKTR